jgi:outer membrane protein OmpA-like peptidoglycan-associated protein
MTALKWAWVPILLALIGWLLVHRAHQAPPAAGGTAPYGGTEVQSGGAKMPNLQNLTLTPGSAADNLAKTVTSGDFSHPVSLQDLSFDSSGNLADSARGQIKQLGSVLNAAPNLKIRLTGYGQTQDAGQSQADAIKSALTSAGVSPDRISTTGEAGNQAPSLSVAQ